MTLKDQAQREGKKCTDDYRRIYASIEGGESVPTKMHFQDAQGDSQGVQQQNESRKKCPSSQRPDGQAE